MICLSRADSGVECMSCLCFRLIKKGGALPGEPGWKPQTGDIGMENTSQEILKNVSKSAQIQDNTTMKQSGSMSTKANTQNFSLGTIDKELGIFSSGNTESHPTQHESKTEKEMASSTGDLADSTYTYNKSFSYPTNPTWVFGNSSRGQLKHATRDALRTPVTNENANTTSKHHGSNKVATTDSQQTEKEWYTVSIETMDKETSTAASNYSTTNLTNTKVKPELGVMDQRASGSSTTKKKQKRNLNSSPPPTMSTSQSVVISFFLGDYLKMLPASLLSS